MSLNKKTQLFTALLLFSILEGASAIDQAPENPFIKLASAFNFLNKSTAETAIKGSSSQMNTLNQQVYERARQTFCEAFEAAIKVGYFTKAVQTFKSENDDNQARKAAFATGINSVATETSSAVISAPETAAKAAYNAVAWYNRTAAADAITKAVLATPPGSAADVAFKSADADAAAGQTAAGFNQNDDWTKTFNSIAPNAYQHASAADQALDRKTVAQAISASPDRTIPSARAAGWAAGIAIYAAGGNSGYILNATNFAAWDVKNTAEAAANAARAAFSFVVAKETCPAIIRAANDLAKVQDELAREKAKTGTAQDTEKIGNLEGEVSQHQEILTVLVQNKAPFLGANLNEITQSLQFAPLAPKTAADEAWSFFIGSRAEHDSKNAFYSLRAVRGVGAAAALVAIVALVGKGVFTIKDRYAAWKKGKANKGKKFGAFVKALVKGRVRSRRR